MPVTDETARRQKSVGIEGESVEERERAVGSQLEDRAFAEQTSIGGRPVKIAGSILYQTSVWKPAVVVISEAVEERERAVGSGVEDRALARTARVCRPVEVPVAAPEGIPS